MLRNDLLLLTMLLVFITCKSQEKIKIIANNLALDVSNIEQNSFNGFLKKESKEFVLFFGKKQLEKEENYTLVFAVKNNDDKKYEVKNTFTGFKKPISIKKFKKNLTVNSFQTLEEYCDNGENYEPEYGFIDIGSSDTKPIVITTNEEKLLLIYNDGWMINSKILNKNKQQESNRNFNKEFLMLKTKFTSLLFAASSITFYDKKTKEYYFYRVDVYDSEGYKSLFINKLKSTNLGVELIFSKEVDLGVYGELSSNLKFIKWLSSDVFSIRLNKKDHLLKIESSGEVSFL